MKNKMLLLFVFVTLPNLIPSGFAQETPQYFDQTMRLPNNCPVTHLYATKFIIPVQVRIIHDPTPNFVVGSAATNSTAPTSNSVVTFNGDDKYSFNVRTNSTGQFSFLAKAGYNDGKEHDIWVQYWSENQQVQVDQFTTLNGQFCRNFLVDTAPPPPIIDIQKTIQQAEAQTFAEVVAVLTEDHNSLGELQVVVIVFLGAVIFVQIINMVFHNSENRWRESDRKKMAKLEGKFDEGARMLIVQMKHITMKEMNTDEKIDKFIQTLLIHFDLFRNEMLNAVKSNNKVQTSQVQPETPKPEEKISNGPGNNTDSITTEDIKLEELEPANKITEEAEEPVKKTGLGKFMSSIQDHIKKKQLQPKKQKILSEEDWFKVLSEEKKLTKEQATKAYVKLEKYVNGHRDDVNAYNKLMALYKIAVGDRDDTTG